MQHRSNAPPRKETFLETTNSAHGHVAEWTSTAQSKDNDLGKDVLNTWAPNGLGD